MKITLGCLLIWLSLLTQLAAEVVINEICYDPEGNDEGKEWIELYNNGNENVQLQGAIISAGGASFTMQFTLPAFVLRPGRYLLIGESLVPNAQLIGDLNLQNATDGTDGIRYLSPNGSYTDTVLYGSPNNNQLPDDLGVIGTTFAPDVPGGYALARHSDGVDTNLCAEDFISEPNPTPGLPNRRHCDYALGKPTWELSEDFLHLNVHIRNLSNLTPTAYANFTVSQDDNILWESQIAPIAPGDSVLSTSSFIWNEGAMELKLVLPDDPDSTNNLLSFMPQGTQTSSLYINEFMADPKSDGQEWIELYATSSKTIDTRTEYGIRDASDNLIRFVMPDNEGYYVVCPDSAAMVLAWPNCPANRIIEASAWANLNNDGDSMALLCDGEVLDSLAYEGEELIKGTSRERYLDTEQSPRWRNSYAPEGGTPGAGNSLPPVQDLPDPGKIALSGSPFSPLLGERIAIAYHLQAPANRISCHIFDLNGTKISTLADYTLSGESGALYWDGTKQNGKYAPRGLYIVLWESQASSGGKILRKQLTAVLNR